MFSKSIKQYISSSAKLLVLPAMISSMAVGSLMMPAPKVEAQSTLDATSTPFGLEFVNVCKRTLKWRTSNRTDADGDRIPESYFEDQSQAICVSQDNAYLNGELKVAKYADFETIPATKTRAEVQAYFGNDEVMGITSQQLNLYDGNGNIVAQGTNHNRATNDTLDKIFPQTYIDTVWSSGGDKKGIPIRFDTGPDTFTVKATNGLAVYQGGLCDINNGNISVRGSIPVLPGYKNLDIPAYIRDGLKKDPNNVKQACGRLTNGSYLPQAQDKNLLVYQFLYEYNLPKTQQECEIIYYKSANVNFNDCVAAYKAFLKEQFGTSADTTVDFNRVMLANTYYATFDDSATSVRGLNYIIKPTAANNSFTNGNHVIIENSSATGTTFADFCLTGGNIDTNKCMEVPEPKNGIKVMVRATASAKNRVVDEGSDDFKNNCKTDNNFDVNKCYYIPKSGLVAFTPAGSTIPEVGRADKPGDTIVDLDDYFGGARTTAPKFIFKNTDGDVTENYSYSSVIVRKFVGWKNPDSDLFDEPRRNSDSAFAREIAESTVVLKAN